MGDEQIFTLSEVEWEPSTGILFFCLLPLCLPDTLFKEKKKKTTLSLILSLGPPQAGLLLEAGDWAPVSALLRDKACRGQ